MSAARIVWTGFVVNLKMLGTSSFFLLTSVVQPIVFATIAFYMYRSGGRAGTLLYAALGAGMMGIWSSTLFGSGGALQWNRWQGTLELLVAAPAHFSLVMLPVTLAMSTIGVYSMAATLLWGRLVFGIELHIEHLFVFCVAVVVTIVAVGMCGFLLAVTFVRYRTAWALGNLLEYPVWLATGLLFPIALLPSWVRPLSWLLAPTWGIQAIRHAALGGGAVWFPVAMCAAIGVLYLVLAGYFLRVFERAARARATLALT